MARTLSLDDIFAIERVTDARISPDGARVAFTVTREFTEGEHATPTSGVWVVPFDGQQPPRLFTASIHADRSPRWSPDGKSLAFLSDREKADTVQVYIMPADGGEARKLTSAKAGVSDFAWSPDGARIAYLAPESQTEDEEKRAKERDDAIHVDHDYKFTRLWVIDAAGGEARALTPPEYQVRDFAWRHDGWAIVTSPTPKEDDMSLAWPVRLVSEDGRSPDVLAGQVSRSAGRQLTRWADSRLGPQRHRGQGIGGRGLGGAGGRGARSLPSATTAAASPGWILPLTVGRCC